MSNVLTFKFLDPHPCHQRRLPCAMVVHLPKLDARHSLSKRDSLVCLRTVLLTLTLALVYLTLKFQYPPRALGLLP
jgi:hypothetical protein